MREFIFAWVNEFPDDEITVAVPRVDVSIARRSLPARVAVAGTRLRPQGVSAVLELPFVALKVGAEVIVTHNFTPAFGRSAVFIHDLMFTTNPEWFTRKERAYFALMPLTAKRAKWVFTSSKSEADRIKKSTGRERVTAVGLGLAHQLDRAVPVPPRGTSNEATFILSVGRLNVRKNLENVIAGALSSSVVTPECPLIIVGEPGGRSSTFPAATAAAIESGAIRFLGLITEAELAWLYEHTRAFLFLSLDEGFGIPSLEALRFGAPIIASDLPVFHEIIGAFGRYVDPSDVLSIGMAIRDTVSGDRPSPHDPEGLGYSWKLAVHRIREAIVRDRF